MLENDFYGVEAYGPIDLVVHYMDAPKRFTETVPACSSHLCVCDGRLSRSQP